MSAFILRWVITTVAVFVAAHIIPGISYSGGGALFVSALLLGIINAFVRPVLLLLSLPFIVVTMGLFILVVNALLLWLVASLVPGFIVSGFWSAFFGALVIGLVSWPLSCFFRASDGRMHVITHHPAIKQADARVIK